MQQPIRTIISAAVVALMASSTVNAGSFSLYTEASGRAIGNYAAGSAAEAADASTGWYNPAGLALIHNKQAVFGGVGVFPSTKLTGISTFSTLGAQSYVETYDGLQGAKSAFVPSFHYAMPLGENATFGLSMVAPFGLLTDWSKESPVRYAGTISQLTTTNFSPEIGGRLSENFALGAGIDLQYARVTFNRMLGLPTATQFTPFGANYLDSMSYNKGTSFAVGFHAGVMGMFNANHTRIGLNYQSKMNHKFHGYSRLTGRLASLAPVATPAALFAVANANNTFWSDNLMSNNVDLPDVMTLSGYHDINEKLALLGSVVYTGWHTLKTIELDNVAAYAPNVGQAKVNSISNENYRNVWRVSVGANYSLDQQWMLRVGTGYDQTPTRDAERSVRVPDSDRWAASAGVHYQMKSNLGLDLGYTHLFAMNTARINRSDIAGATSLYNVNARVNAYADLVGLQATWSIDAPAPVYTK